MLLGRTQCYECFIRFKSSRQSIEDELRVGKVSTSTDTHVQKIKNSIRANRCLTVKELVEEFDWKIEHVQSYSKVCSSFNGRTVAGKWPATMTKHSWKRTLLRCSHKSILQQSPQTRKGRRCQQYKNMVTWRSYDKMFHYFLSRPRICNVLFQIHSQLKKMKHCADNKHTNSLKNL